MKSKEDIRIVRDSALLAVQSHEGGAPTVAVVSALSWVLDDLPDGWPAENLKPLNDVLQDFKNAFRNQQ